MPYCHFSRVFVGTTLWDLKANNEKQVSQNCKKIEYMGLNLETGSDRLLKLIGKQHTNEQAINVFHTIKTSSIELVFFIYDFMTSRTQIIS